MSLEVNAALNDYTSWRVGGNAKLLFKPQNRIQLIDFLKSNTEKNLLWLGLGSNTLIRDGGYPGTVIITQGALDTITHNNNSLFVEAGTSCAKLARHSARLGLHGLEFMAGIPGTVGGALKMNAGCHGGETWTFVHKVQTINARGEIFMRDREDYQVFYRQVNDPFGEWFLGAEFVLPGGDPVTAKQKIKDLIAHRSQTQPINFPSGGSVFRNPPDNYAAKLIEQAGLKNFNIGNARISSKHANFIINEGGATAREIEELIHHIQNVVHNKFNIQLVPEIHIYGEK